MKLYRKTCKNAACNKEFMGSRTQQYCCQECRPIRYIPKRKPKTLESCTLDEVTKLAKENGVSYGKYVAMQYQAERKKK